MTTLLMRGVAVPSPGAASPVLREIDPLIEARPLGGISIAPDVRGEPQATVAIDALRDTDLVEVELEGSFRLWMSVAELRHSPLMQTHAEGTAVRLEPTPAPAGTRGIGEWVVKGLQFFRLSPAKAAGKLARGAVAARIEARIGEPNLYVLSGTPVPTYQVFATPAKPSDAPYLLFLHGTASSTEGSFSGLWRANDGAAFAELASRYEDGHVLALQHRTLTETPVDNALAVAKLLPDGARLHLVSHSRGGLVGELLCRASVGDGEAPFTKRELEVFAKLSSKEDERQLAALNTLLAKKRFRVERFVRVACPARGTTLASGKIERYCSVMLNVLGNIPGMALSPTTAAVLELLKGFVAGLVDMKDVPGLASMNPSSAIMHVINSGIGATGADLSIIAGDTEGSGMWSKLGMLAVDAFFTRENDLVVDTPAMIGGTRRTNGAYRYLQRSADINHFQYFDHATTVRRLLAALADRAGGAPAGFEAVELDQSVLRGRIVTAPRPVRSAPANPPIVFVLPGIMGSHIEVKSDRIWLDYDDLLLGGFGKLRVSTPKVEAKGLHDSYADLVDFLAESHEVIPFPYDWRLSIEAAGARLNQAIRAKLQSIDAAQRPIRIVAHSMGGLVTRAMMARDDSAWTDVLKHPQARFLMLGTPNGGSHATTQLMLGREKLLRMLATLDVSHSLQDLVAIASEFSGGLDMLPSPSDRDYFDPGAWREFLQVLGASWPLPKDAELDRARKLRATLATQTFDPKRVFYVAGQADETPVGIRIEEKNKRKQIVFLGTAAGDGRVPWDTGIPKELKPWFVRVVHGDIPAHKRAFSGFLDILEKGDTNLLSRERPATTRAAQDVFELRDEPVTYLADADDLQRAATGRSRSRRPAETAPPRIPVRVSWGDLRYAKHATMVGHYAGDTIVSGEAALDRHLGGVLRDRHRMGVYPGALDSHLVVSEGVRGAPGAIVVGLGEVGALSSGGLSRTVATGTLAWLAEQVDVHRARGATTLLEVGLSVILIGSGAAGLNVTDASSAILRGVQQAVERTEAVRGGAVTLKEIEIIELFEDRAHTIWHELRMLLGQTELKRRFVRAGRLGALRDGRRRVTSEEPGGWWRRLQIRARGNALRFVNVTDRARSEVQTVRIRRDRIERMIQAAEATSQRDRDFEHVLFELLVPNAFKDAAPRRDNLMLLLDREAARFPWELIGPAPALGAPNNGARPVSVEGGLVRQLAVQKYRAQPAMVESATALVIGEPNAIPDAELSGAAREAKAVVRLLEAFNISVTRLIDKGADEIQRALPRNYRVIHFAGHGVADVAEFLGDKDEPPLSGMIIGEQEVLTSQDIENRSTVPELVFINCCHLGTIARGRQTIASNFGEAFIRMGVRAVVAAGWAVDDRGAELFATTFYTNMLQGASFGEAVRDARAQTFDADPDSNTFGAYQCYGDPDYRLIPTRVAEPTDWTDREFATETELIREGVELVMARGTEDATAAKQLMQLEEGAKKHGYFGSGAVRQALGTAYSRLRLYGIAIEHFSAAVCATHSPACVDAIERLFNLETRHAAQEYGVGAVSASTAARRVRHALRMLENLCAVAGETSERLSLIGGAHKRLAQIETGAKRLTALETAARKYEEAMENAFRVAQLVGSNTTKVDAYSAGQASYNYALAGLYARATKSKQHADRAHELFERIDTVPPPGREGRESFWDDAAWPDWALGRALVDRKLSANDADAIAAAYVEAHRRGRDSGKLASIVENLEFTVSMLSKAPNPAAKALASRVASILERVKAAG